MKEVTAIVLAAGKGERMKSQLPKMLHDLKGKPLIYYTLKELTSLRRHIKQIIVVVGYKGRLVQEYIRKDFKGIDFVSQKGISGTASAVKCAKPKVRYKNILIVCGDTPLITRNTLQSFVSFALKRK